MAEQLVRHPDGAEMIPQPRCQRGGVYRVHARSFPLACFDGERFWGLRDKRGRMALFGEFHRDCTDPLGTVSPYELVAVLPDGVEPVPVLGYLCGRCGTEVVRAAAVVTSAPPVWRHVTAQPSCPGPVEVAEVPNEALEVFLAELEEHTATPAVADPTP